MRKIPWVSKLTNCLLLVFAILSTVPSQAIANSDLSAIIDENVQLEQVVTGFEFTEGPVWDDAGFLLFSDIPADTIYKFWTAEEKLEVYRHPSGNANGNTLNQEGNLLSAEYANHRISLTYHDGTVVNLASQYQGKNLHSPNDLVIKSDGSIYFTDPDYSPQFIDKYNLKKHSQQLNFYGVYRLAEDGKLTLLAKDFTHPNGLAFSPDEQNLYITDFRASQIHVFDVKPDGSITNGRIFAVIKDSDKLGKPDGIKVDSLGHVYCTDVGGVRIFSPSGTFLGMIKVPEIPANLSWGDSDHQTLYITARSSIYRIRLKVKGFPQ